MHAFSRPLRQLLLAGVLMALGQAAARGQIPHEDGWPPSLTAVPTAPAWSFCQEGGAIAVYELLLTSLEPRPVKVERLSVLDAAGKSLQSLGAPQVAANSRLARGLEAPDPKGGLTLTQGSSALVHMWVPLGPCPVAEVSLLHSLRVSGERSSGQTFTRQLQGLVPLQPRGPALSAGPPVKGMWMLSNGLSNDSNHRTVIIPSGEWFISQKFGFDLVKIADDGTDIDGEVTDNSAHLSYNEPVYAMADGEIVAVGDGLAENVPTGKRGAEFIFENVAGNYLILKAAPGTYFLYAHLIPFSLTVEEGDRVKKGQVIGRVGNSGNSVKPHLHIHAMTQGGSPNSAHGRPFHFEEFEVILRQYNFSAQHRKRLSETARTGETRRNELPPSRTLIRWR